MAEILAVCRISLFYRLLMLRKFLIALSLLCNFIFLLSYAQPVYAVSPTESAYLQTAPKAIQGGGGIDDWPDKMPITTEQELVEWYYGSVQEGFPSREISVSGTLHLDAAGERQLTTMFCGLRVQSGGELILDNQELSIVKGLAVPITVEAGGKLTLLQPFVFGSMADPDPAIVIEKGGMLTGAEHLPYGTPVRDENEVQPPPEILPPPVEDERTPIVNVFDEDFCLSCVVGERPEPGQYPDMVHVAVGGWEAPLLPVEWDFPYVDFDTEGIYLAVGNFTKPGLDEHMLSNPKGFTISMVVNVYEEGPPDSLRGFLLSTQKNGPTLIKLTMSILQMDEVTAVYIYRSDDNLHWKRETWSGAPVDGVFPKEENFLSLVRTEGRNSQIPYRYQTDYKPIWIRVEIVGSKMEGISNSIYLETDERPPEEQTAGGDDGLGNRGGGGQNESERKFTSAQGKRVSADHLTKNQEAAQGSNTASPDVVPKQTPGAAAKDLILLPALSQEEEEQRQLPLHPPCRNRKQLPL